jgi:hypothetical protein
MGWFGPNPTDETIESHVPRLPERTLVDVINKGEPPVSDPLAGMYANGTVSLPFQAP